MLHDVLLVLIGLIIGAVIGFFLSRLFMKKYLQKNPPINETVISNLMTSMWRKPNSKQIKQVMAQMNRMNK